MKIITFEEIRNLNVLPQECIQWTEEALKNKYTTILPHKTSLTFRNGSCFFNTMPCLIPDLNRFGVKEVSRYPENKPSLSGELLLYDSNNGELLALMDADWITAMRTGAVAASTIKHLRHSTASEYSFLGLGNTARTTMLCLLENEPQKEFKVKLLRYKDQAELFSKRFQKYKNVSFEIVDTNEDLIQNTDVIVSCVTTAEELLGAEEWFKPGVLVVPVHTRGFQNCDLFFDKVFADDKAHVEGFKHFKKFRKFDEFARVLRNENPGRESDKERILAYNIGLALHDVYFASRLYERLEKLNHKEIRLKEDLPKFWV